MSDALRHLREYDVWRNARLKKPLPVTPEQFMLERRQQEAVETLDMLAMRLNLAGNPSVEDSRVMLSEIISTIRTWEDGAA